MNTLRGGGLAPARGGGAYTLGCSVFVMMSTSVFSIEILLPVGLLMICESARNVCLDVERRKSARLPLRADANRPRKGRGRGG